MKTNNETLIKEYFVALATDRAPRYKQGYGNISIHKDMLLSYSSLIAWTMPGKDGKRAIICNSSGYSNATRKHEHYMRQYVPDDAIHFASSKLPHLADAVDGTLWRFFQSLASHVIRAHENGLFSRKPEREKLIQNASALLDFFNNVEQKIISEKLAQKLRAALVDFTRPDASQYARKIQKAS